MLGSPVGCRCCRGCIPDRLQGAGLAVHREQYVRSAGRRERRPSWE
ncbi:MAG: hypothetical protein MZV64_23190 [Ignavibacteriales bacterium]|nr:hypothetical protein [Ignavibacteriales bacterium]